MARLFRQGRNDTAEGEERLVDHACFPGAFVGSAGSSDRFGSSQVDEVELPDTEEVVAAIGEGRLFDVDRNGKDGMRSPVNSAYLFQLVGGGTYEDSVFILVSATCRL